MSVRRKNDSQPVCRLRLPIPASHWVALEAPSILSMHPPDRFQGWLCKPYTGLGEPLAFISSRQQSPRPSAPSKAGSRSGRAGSLQLVISSRTQVLRHVAQKPAGLFPPPRAHTLQPLNPDSPRTGDYGPGGGSTWTILRSSGPSHLSTEVQLQGWHVWCPNWTAREGRSHEKGVSSET